MYNLLIVSMMFTILACGKSYQAASERGPFGGVSPAPTSTPTPTGVTQASSKSSDDEECD